MTVWQRFGLELLFFGIGTVAAMRCVGVRIPLDWITGNQVIQDSIAVGVFALSWIGFATLVEGQKP